MDIPSELRFNILGYAGERLNLSNTELIDEIHQYEPTFDYDFWLYQIMRKNAFVSVYNKNHPLHDLFKYLIENQTHIETDGDETILTQNAEQAKKIASLLESLGYNVSKIQDRNIYLNDIDAFSYDIRAIGIFYPESDQFISWAISVDNANRIGKSVTSLPYTISILDIPNTLSGYLRYIIKRKKDEERIMKSKFYPLYLMLDKYKEGWVIFREDNDHFVLDPQAESNDDKTIYNELIKIYGYSNVQKKGISYHIKGKYPSELIDIEKFYHPYVIGYISFG